MPFKVPRRQGLSCHLDEIDGMQVEKATGCKTEWKDGELLLGSQSLVN